MLLICFSSSLKGLYVCCLYVCLGLEFLGSENTGLVKEECSPLDSPFSLTWLLNWGRPMSCRELQFTSKQWQWLPESPATSLRGRAGLGLRLCLGVMGSHWLSSFNSWIFRLLSRLHKSTAPIQKIHVKCPQAIWVLRTNIWQKTPRRLLLPSFWADGRILKVDAYGWSRHF